MNTPNLCAGCGQWPQNCTCPPTFEQALADVETHLPPLVEPEAQEPWQCPKCFSTYPLVDHTCTHCGAFFGMPDASKAGVEVPGQNALIPCPHCGSADIHVQKVLCVRPYKAVCFGCFASTNECDTEQEARAAWDRRIAPADNAQAVLQRAFELASEWEREADKPWHPLICNTYGICGQTLRDILQTVAPSVVAQTDEEIARKLARKICAFDQYSMAGLTDLIHEAIRKAKSVVAGVEEKRWTMDTVRKLVMGSKNSFQDVADAHNASLELPEAHEKSNVNP